MGEPGDGCVLVIDDDLGTIELLRSILEPVHRVLTASEGPTGLRIAASELPDLILLDIVMPGMDGYEVCRRLKADPLTEGIPVIFITSKDEEEEEARGLGLGGIDYIIKPISAPILDARVRNHLDLKRYRDLLEDLSMKDGLTGVANRRRFDEVFGREWEHAVRHRLPISVLLIDVDHFKQFNDNYGHGAGDECLLTLARTLEGAVRRHMDLLARYGGEEFACLLAETDEESGRVVADRLRAQVKDLRIPHAFSSASSYVTVSVGAAATVPAADDDPMDLLSHADRLLYHAKESGRDRTASGTLRTWEEASTGERFATERRRSRRG
jgi:diguanylate cyclase (GGDEF)-like protein